MKRGNQQRFGRGNEWKGMWSGRHAVELQRYFHVGVGKKITILKEEQMNYKRNSKEGSTKREMCIGNILEMTERGETMRC